ncbi:MAG: NB-ARC domain-containing protein [candidate division KSB1 bacterium]|nr:NB-ARC domain-containing protein [candidate division KSB1 bacterium]MDZ7402448.1 NB-ARC domain-containing protein [candidate division KSB1 bacterium]
MFNTTAVKSALERLAEGTGTSKDKQLVLDALNQNKITFASGERSLAIGGNVTDAVIVVGNDNIIFKGDAADTLRDALATFFAPKPGCAPPVPDLVIGREEALNDLKRRLGVYKTSGEFTEMQVLTTVRGWPGVGKTTVATAVAHDPDIQRTFPDGVLWISLGQRPHLLSEIATWGRALGTDELLKTPTLKEATAQLSALLRKKRMLLLVDDVWEVEHAAPFQQARGKDCALLITTREAGVANALAPKPEAVYNLPVLTEDNAVKLLRILAPSVVEQHEAECRELVRHLECLPLALRVAGHLLHMEANMGWGVTDLLKELETGAKILSEQAPADRIDYETQTIPTVAALLKNSTDRLDEQTRECFAYLGAFAPKPATFDINAMKFVWQVEDARPIVRELVNRGLLEPVGSRFQMHALLVAHARSLCEE